MLFKSHSPEETKKLAKLLAAAALKYRSKKKAFTIGLQGELGSGKTTFIQGFASGLHIRNKITSPTFLLIRCYHLPNYLMTHYKNFYHIDVYRIKKTKELLTLGLEEIFKNPKSIVLIEWAEKIKKLLPKQMIWITFRHSRKENEREIRMRCRN